jgi:ribosomal protein S27E
MNVSIVRCIECGNTITLDPGTYWDVSDTDIRCDKCKALITITLERGLLKKASLKEAGGSK